MKKYLSLSLIALFLFSCSGDDATPVTAENPEPENPQTSIEGILVQTTTKMYENGSVFRIETTDYENGRPITESTYNSSSTLQYTAKFNYNTAGLLESNEFYNPDNFIYNTTSFDYDEQQRLLKITQESNTENISDLIYNFTYNSDNTISGTGGGMNKTYVLNENGFIIKQIDISSIKTFALDEVHHMPLSYVYSSSGPFSETASYVYDDVHNPELLNLANLYGTSKTNALLSNIDIYEAPLYASTRYLIKKTVTSEFGQTIFEDIYTWNDLGLPTKKKSYRNDELLRVTDYIYQ